MLIILLRGGTFLIVVNTSLHSVILYLDFHYSDLRENTKFGLNLVLYSSYSLKCQSLLQQTTFIKIFSLFFTENKT